MFKKQAPPVGSSPTAGKPPMKKPPTMAHKQQVSEDTEREMLGKPQIHGAAMPDADVSAPPNKMAGMAPPPGAEGAPPDSGQGDQDDNSVEALKSENQELRARLEQVEKHLGIGQHKQAPPNGGAPANGGAPPPPQEEHYEDGGY